MDGLINLDKPAGMSSARAVDTVKRLLPRKTKVGHAGTLDPFATGVLVLLVGRATRLCEQIMAQPKQYLASIKLGATTETLDPQSPELPAGPLPPLSAEAVAAVLPRFVGRIQQTPPAYSALKIAGRRAYDLARTGHDVYLPPRPVHVHGIQLLEWKSPLLSLRIDCGKGTYIRSLARDIAESLGTTGYLTTLQRTRVGPCTIADSVTLDRLAADGPAAHLLAAAGY